MVWTHVHTINSFGDALSHAADNVARAKQLGYPALAITDHGNMGGAVQHYIACRKAEIEPLIGIEAYVAVERSREVSKGRKRAETFHLTMLAVNLEGYRNLVRLNNQAHRNYYYQPVIDLGDLAQAAEQGGLDGIYGLSGCWFGLGPRALREGSPVAVLGLLKALSGWFGAGFAIELMHHEISDAEHDDGEHINMLHTISERLDLPTVISQDSHYVLAQDRVDHDLFKWLTSWGKPDEAQWPGKLGYHMVGFDEVKHLYPKRIWDKAMDGMLDLLAMSHLRIPELEEYNLRVPDISTLGESTEMELHGVVDDALSEYLDAVGTRSKRKYWERLEDELEVIGRSGFAGYLMLVRAVCQELDRRGIVWAARGSASGSLVCYLLGITAFDPLVWRLRFDRFLSTDRTKPPDIDIDMDPEHREEMFEYLGTRFHTLRIGTWSKFKLRAEDDDDFDPDNPQKGSLVRQYKYAVGKILEGKHGSDRSKWPKAAHDEWNAEIPPDEWKRLARLDRYKAYKNYSTHAAGLIITDDESVIEEIPQLHVANKDYMVSAFDKDDVERLGLVKLDLLNLKLLTAIRVMQDVSGVAHADVPPNDAKVFTHINRGNVTGLFQLEGGSTKFGIKRLRPRKVEDLVAAVALFRPATMDSGATEDYLRRRAGDFAVPTRHALIDKVTKETYGILLYQEQAIEIFRELGMTIEEIEKARSAIKASNAGIHDAGLALEELMVRVRELSAAQGMSDEDEKWLEHTLRTFSGYCVTGDTVITKSSGGNHTPQTMTVKELHDVWHGPNTPTRKKYRSRRGVTIMARDTSDGRIRPFKVKSVWCSGERQVWKVTLGNGMSITSTGNHRHLTQYGWVETDDLTSDHQLAVMDEPETVINYEYYVPKAIRDRVRAAGECKFCGRTEGRLEMAHLNHDRQDNSPENLVLLCNHCHKQHDWDTGRRQPRHSRGRPLSYSPVVSVVNAGVQVTYDLEMDSPDHSWVGNGIVTHNSFNRSHAVSYAVWAYKAAWYSLHHPVAFWTGMLNAHVENDERVAKYLKAAREAGVVIRNPHVSTSGMNFSADPKAQFIYKGLRTIVGIGVKTAEELVRHQPYTSLDDLALKVGNRAVTGSKNLALGVHPADCTGAIAILHKAGALRGLEFEPVAPATTE